MAALHAPYATVTAAWRAQRRQQPGKTSVLSEENTANYAQPRRARQRCIHGGALHSRACRMSATWDAAFVEVKESGKLSRWKKK